MTPSVDKLRKKTPANEIVMTALAGQPIFLTKAETADLLRVDLSTVTRLINAKRLVPIKLGDMGGKSRVLIPRAELERYLSSMVKGPVDAE